MAQTHFALAGLALLVIACGDDIAPLPCAVDAGHDDCCSLWPDAEAIAACAKLPPGTCGDVVCFTGSCDDYVRINVCGPKAVR